MRDASYHQKEEHALCGLSAFSDGEDLIIVGIALSLFFSPVGLGSTFSVAAFDTNFLKLSMRMSYDLICLHL